MEELTEILTWYKLKLHAKPVALLNVDGYYDHFLKWVRMSDIRGSVVERERVHMLICSALSLCLTQLCTVEPPNKGHFGDNI